MAKTKSKTKSNTKSKFFTKLFTFIVLLLIVIFALVCYFNPEIYNKIKSFFHKDSNSQVEGEYVVVNTLEDAKVHFIDVGQGDAILITLPDYKNVLIDAGDRNKDNNAHVIDYIKENAHKKGLSKTVTIDYFILTHSDADHAGGADEVLEEFDVKKVLRPYIKYTGKADAFSSTFNKGYKECTTVTYSEFLTALQNEKYGANETQCEWEFFNFQSDFSGGVIYNDVKYSYYFDFLTPITDVEKINYKDVNDYSPIIKFSYQDTSVMLTGDAEKDAEEDFVSQYSSTDDYLDVDVLKVGHHGSSTSSSQAFLDIIKPEVAVISCGVGNSYKHPHKESMNRFFVMECSIYRTDLHGDIVMVIEETGEYTFTADKVNDNVFVTP